MGFLYGLLPVLIVLFAALNSFTGAAFLLLGSYAHPFIAMATQSADLAMPGATRGLSLAWEIHCLVMLALSLGVAALCVPLIRRVSLRMAVGGGMSRAKPQPLPAAPARRARAASAQPLGYDRRLASKSDLIAAGLEPPALPAAHRPPPTPAQAERGIRRVVGPPVLWKETRGPWLFRTTWAKVSFILKLSLLVLVNILFAGLSSHAVASPHYHAAVLAILTGMVVIVVAVTSAATVTAEKETRALPVLLTTPLSNAQIIAGKFVGTLRRLVGPMVPLFGHLLFFVFIGLLAQSGFIRPLAIFHLGLILVPMVCFYNASGLYFSSKFKKTSAAVVANLGLALTLLLLAPVALGTLGLEGPAELAVTANPPVQVAIVIEASGWPEPSQGWFEPQSGRYHWPIPWRTGEDEHVLDSFGTTCLLTSIGLIYLAAAAAFFLRAGENLRKGIF